MCISVIWYHCDALSQPAAGCLLLMSFGAAATLSLSERTLFSMASSLSRACALEIGVGLANSDSAGGTLKRPGGDERHEGGHGREPLLLTRALGARLRALKHHV